MSLAAECLAETFFSRFSLQSHLSFCPQPPLNTSHTHSPSPCIPAALFICDRFRACHRGAGAASWLGDGSRDRALSFPSSHYAPHDDGHRWMQLCFLPNRRCAGATWPPDALMPEATITISNAPFSPCSLRLPVQQALLCLPHLPPVHPPVLGTD